MDHLAIIFDTPAKEQKKFTEHKKKIQTWETSSSENKTSVTQNGGWVGYERYRGPHHNVQPDRPCIKRFKSVIPTQTNEYIAGSNYKNHGKMYAYLQTSPPS